jgi:hypothetical protein
MVKQKDLKQFFDDVKEVFGFLMSQEIASSSLTPKDTTRMARSFPSTYIYSNSTINWSTPYYTKFVNDGTKTIKARRFIQQNLHQNTGRLFKKALRIVDKKYR